MDTREMCEYVKNNSKQREKELEHVCDLVRHFIKVEQVESKADKEFNGSMKGFQEDVKRLAKVLDKSDDLVGLVKDRAYCIIDMYIERLMEGKV